MTKMAFSAYFVNGEGQAGQRHFKHRLKTLAITAFFNSTFAIVFPQIHTVFGLMSRFRKMQV